MNYLAHLTLSHFSTDLQVGNYLGDILRGREVDALPASIRRGVVMHRAIDRLTDGDREVRKANKLLSKRHGRYAPVISDIAFDYYLCRNWETFGPAPFTAFTQTTYAGLLQALPFIPERVHPYVRGMTGGDWLRMYQSKEGMNEVFTRFLRRLSQPERLDGLAKTLEDYDDQLNRALLLLFPRLQALADTYRDPS